MDLSKGLISSISKDTPSKIQPDKKSKMIKKQIEEKKNVVENLNEENSKIKKQNLENSLENNQKLIKKIEDMSAKDLSLICKKLSPTISMVDKNIKYKKINQEIYEMISIKKHFNRSSWTKFIKDQTNGKTFEKLKEYFIQLAIDDVNLCAELFEFQMIQPIAPKVEIVKLQIFSTPERKVYRKSDKFVIKSPENDSLKPSVFFFDGNGNVLSDALKKMIPGNQEKCESIIYQWVHLKTGRSFIGHSEKDIVQRTQEHLMNAFHQSESLKEFHFFIRKSIPEDWKIFVLQDRIFSKDLQILEKKYIDRYDTYLPNGFNLKNQ